MREVPVHCRKLECQDLPAEQLRARGRLGGLHRRPPARVHEARALRTTARARRRRRRPGPPERTRRRWRSRERAPAAEGRRRRYAVQRGRQPCRGHAPARLARGPRWQRRRILQPPAGTPGRPQCLWATPAPTGRAARAPSDAPPPAAVVPTLLERASAPTDTVHTVGSTTASSPRPPRTRDNEAKAAQHIAGRPRSGRWRTTEAGGRRRTSRKRSTTSERCCTAGFSSLSETPKKM